MFTPCSKFKGFQPDSVSVWRPSALLHGYISLLSRHHLHPLNIFDPRIPFVLFFSALVLRLKCVSARSSYTYNHLVRETSLSITVLIDVASDMEFVKRKTQVRFPTFSFDPRKMRKSWHFWRKKNRNEDAILIYLSKLSGFCNYLFQHKLSSVFFL